MYWKPSLVFGGDQQKKACFLFLLWSCSFKLIKWMTSKVVVRLVPPSTNSTVTLVSVRRISDKFSVHLGGEIHVWIVCSHLYMQNKQKFWIGSTPGLNLLFRGCDIWRLWCMSCKQRKGSSWCCSSGWKRHPATLSSRRHHAAVTCHALWSALISVFHSPTSCQLPLLRSEALSPVGESSWQQRCCDTNLWENLSS